MSAQRDAVPNYGTGESESKSTPSHDKIEAEAIVDVRFILAVLWRGKWIILLFAILGSLIGYRDLRGFTPSYTAEMIVEQTDQGGRGRSNLSGLASTFGLDVAGSQKSSTLLDRVEVVLSTTAFAERLDNEYALLRRVYGGAWDSQSQEWKRPIGQRFELEQRIRRALHLSTWREPDLESLAKYVSNGIVIRRFAKQASSFKRISFEHSDPDFALYLLELVYREGEAYLRKQDKAEGLERREYILGQLQKNTIVDLRTVLMEMLAREEQTAMLMEGDLPYAARVVQPPRVSSHPSEPDLRKIFGLPIMIMISFSILAIALVGVFRRESK